MPDSYYYRTAKVGQTVIFPCHTELPKDVNWERLATPQSRKRIIYMANLGLRDLGLYPQFTFLIQNQSHSLVIYNVTIDDSAEYRCVEGSGSGNRHVFTLTVEGKYPVGEKPIAFIVLIFLTLSLSLLVLPTPFTLSFAHLFQTLPLFGPYFPLGSLNADKHSEPETILPLNVFPLM